MLVLASVPVHKTSLANQHFNSTLLGRREGVSKKSTLCMLVKMLKIMDALNKECFKTGVTNGLHVHVFNNNAHTLQP